jgi:hypothetical protein
MPIRCGDSVSVANCRYDRCISAFENYGAASMVEACLFRSSGIGPTRDGPPPQSRRRLSAPQALQAVRTHVHTKHQPGWGPFAVDEAGHRSGSLATFNPKSCASVSIELRDLQHVLMGWPGSQMPDDLCTSCRNGKQAFSMLILTALSTAGGRSNAAWRGPCQFAMIRMKSGKFWQRTWNFGRPCRT